MADFNKAFTSSTSIKPSSFNDAGGNSENELNLEMDSRLKSPNKKQLPTKHFMSPTISAAIKAAAAVPKRKILAERNETLDVVEPMNLSRSLSFDSKALKFPVVEADDSVDNSFVADSYDPVKNYLSPRPKFLRYNPSRRRKLVVHQENENKVRKSGSFDDEMPSFDDSTGSCFRKESVEEVKMIDEGGKDEGEREEEEEEEMDEFEEERGLSFKGILKFLLVGIALILTTLAISSMNSLTPSHPLEAIRGFKDQYITTQSSFYRTAGLNFSEVICPAVDPTMGIDLVMGKLSRREIYHCYDQEQDMVETINEVVEEQDGQTEDVYQEEIGSKEGSDLLQDLETGDADDEEVEYDETAVGQDEMQRKEEDSDQLQGMETAENGEEVCYQLQEPEIAISEENYKEAEEESYDHLSKADFHQNDGVFEEDGSVVNEKNSQLRAGEELEIAKEMVGEDLMEKEEVGNNNGVDGNEIVDAETTDVSIRLARFDPIVVASIGVLVLILSFFSLLYHSKRMKTSSPVKTMFTKENGAEEEIKELEPFASPSSLVNQRDEEQIAKPVSFVLHPTENDVPKELSHIRAPTVELLGEFVFGGEVTSSLRSGGMKDLDILADADETNSSLSHGKNKVSLIKSGAGSSIRAKSSHLELPTGDSHSHGSFASEKKPVKKQKGKNADASSSMVMPSPVRRSSRIQNRSVMSP